jgi:hypothetical protein
VLRFLALLEPAPKGATPLPPRAMNQGSPASAALHAVLSAAPGHAAASNDLPPPGRVPQRGRA